uniref:RNA helicase n=1 Tax=Gongylonema pulchrum TaxID=637853 RepID=A0A183E9M7_9BILA
LEKESDDDDEMVYQPAHGSPGAKASSSGEDGEDEEDDPLDAFMAGVNKQAVQDKAESIRKDKERSLKMDKEEDEKNKGLGRADIDEEDMQESYFRFVEERKANAAEEEEIYEYDEDGNIIWTWKKVIDPLEAVDHAAMNYPSFNKNFYHEHEQIKSMTAIKVYELRNNLNIKVAGLNPPKPVTAFAHFGMDEPLMNVIRKSEYEHPTPIQAQSIPAALSGRDVLGIAKTGSGKTMAYIWPAIVHIMDQPDLKDGDGPIALIVVPTRELALQVLYFVLFCTCVFSVSIPAALSGRDVLGIAKTGSGKTMAYIWPAIVHIMDQPDLKDGDGPIALIVVPTRELALQVYQEAKRYCKVYNISVVCAYGGGSKWEQQNALREGAELVIATPGRIIDLVKINATNFMRVTFLVFDEADRMFDMG